MLKMPDLAGAVEYLAQQPRLVALQFNNVDINFGDEAVTGSEPYRVQTYTGCGHLLKRAIFLQMGGYRTDFVHMGEEVEFCRKAWKAGWEVHMYPRIIVDHRRTPVARFPAKNVYFSTRNLLIISYLHLPLAAMMPKLFSNAILSWWHIWTANLVSVFRGWIDGMKILRCTFPRTYADVRPSISGISARPGLPLAPIRSQISVPAGSSRPRAIALGTAAKRPPKCEFHGRAFAPKRAAV